MKAWPAGTEVDVSMSMVVEAFSGYCARVVISDGEGLTQQKAQIVGTLSDEGRVNLIIVSDDTPDVPVKR